MKITNDEGKEIEVYTADEVTARETAAVTAAVTAKEAEFGKTKAQLDAELIEAKKALGDRAGEFGQFRKLHDDVVAKLTVAERTIYENQLAQKKADDLRIETEKKAHDAMVDKALRAKAGTDDKLFGKMKTMWDAIAVDAKTPEDVERKTLMVLGAIGTSEPDLVASIAGFSGGYTPPKPKTGDNPSFADSERGKAGAAELGLTLEAKK